MLNHRVYSHFVFNLSAFWYKRKWDECKFNKHIRINNKFVNDIRGDKLHVM